jgi:hypothetical protein
MAGRNEDQQKEITKLRKIRQLDEIIVHDLEAKIKNLESALVVLRAQRNGYAYDFALAKDLVSEMAIAITKDDALIDQFLNRTPSGRG